jgi:signal transduction histidine kinase
VKGYGLGLYYVKSMMEKMGGEVALDSRPGQGTTFKLTFNG